MGTRDSLMGTEFQFREGKNLGEDDGESCTTG